MSDVNPAILALVKLASYSQGRQDIFLNPLSGILKLLSIARMYRLGAADTIATGLSDVSDHINSSRFTLRFLVGVANAASLLVDGFGSPDDPYGKIRGVQKLLNIGYSAAELPAYLRMVAPKMVPSVDGDYFSRLSCQFWLCNIALELGITVHQLYKEVCSRKTSSKYHSNNEPKTRRCSSILSLLLTKHKSKLLSLISNSCDGILALNWSFPANRQFIHPIIIVILSVLSGSIGFYSSWRDLTLEKIKSM